MFPLPVIPDAPFITECQAAFRELTAVFGQEMAISLVMLTLTTPSDDFSQAVRDLLDRY